MLFIFFSIIVKLKKNLCLFYDIIFIYLKDDYLWDFDVNLILYYLEEMIELIRLNKGNVVKGDLF